MKCRFTFGPWVYNENSGNIFVKNGIGDYRMVGQVRGWGWLQYKYKKEEDALTEQHHNGYMLAAAPVMFDACMCALKELEKFENVDPKTKEKLLSIKQYMIDNGVVTDNAN